jgi:hypothetical protein
MWSDIIPLEGKCDHLTMYTINSKAITKITKQKILSPIKQQKRRNWIMKNI